MDDLRSRRRVSGDMISRQGSYRDLVAASVKRASSLLISGGYSVLAAAALLPILVEHTTNPAGAYGAIAGLLGNIGGNLIANLVQGAYTRPGPKVISMTWPSWL